MPIEFICDHCGKKIAAPDNRAGTTASCPGCKGKVRVPSAAPPGDDDIYDIAPLDTDEERRRAAAEAEAHRYQHELLHDKVAPADATGPRSPGGGAPAGPDVRAMITGYVKAMGEGQLETAQRRVTSLQRHKDDALEWLDRIAADELLITEISNLPRPVVLGFLRQLRGQL
jgi:hypothetical protein